METCKYNWQHSLFIQVNLHNFLSGSMEAHFVHFKTEYGDLETALTKEDGLAIVAVMFVVIKILHYN
jgi:Eukaryotic-type carbonic anhydrase